MNKDNFFVIKRMKSDPLFVSSTVNNVWGKPSCRRPCWSDYPKLYKVGPLKACFSSYSPMMNPTNLHKRKAEEISNFALLPKDFSYWYAEIIEIDSTDFQRVSVTPAAQWIWKYKFCPDLNRHVRRCHRILNNESEAPWEKKAAEDALKYLKEMGEKFNLIGVKLDI